SVTLLTQSWASTRRMAVSVLATSVPAWRKSDAGIATEASSSSPKRTRASAPADGSPRGALADRSSGDIKAASPLFSGRLSLAQHCCRGFDGPAARSNCRRRRVDDRPLAVKNDATGGCYLLPVSNAGGVSVPAPADGPWESICWSV